MKFIRGERAGYLILAGCLVSATNVIRAGCSSSATIKYCDTLSEDIRKNQIDRNCFVDGLTKESPKKSKLDSNGEPNSLVDQAYTHIQSSAIDRSSTFDNFRFYTNRATFLPLPYGGNELSNELVFAARTREKLDQIISKCLPIRVTTK